MSNNPHRYVLSLLNHRGYNLLENQQNEPFTNKSPTTWKALNPTRFLKEQEWIWSSGWANPSIRLTRRAETCWNFSLRATNHPYIVFIVKYKSCLEFANLWCQSQEHFINSWYRIHPPAPWSLSHPNSLRVFLWSILPIQKDKITLTPPLRFSRQSAASSCLLYSKQSRPNSINSGILAK